MPEKPKYIIDSNILIQSYRMEYGFDICPGFWDLMKKAFQASIIVSHRKVYKEIADGEDELAEWVRSLDKGYFPKETEQDLESYTRLCSWAEHGNYKAAAISVFEGSTYADPWICAKAKAEGYVLVTAEKSEPKATKSIKLPDACLALGVDYCNQYELLRNLKARFLLDEAHSF